MLGKIQSILTILFVAFFSNPIHSNEKAQMHVELTDCITETTQIDSLKNNITSVQANYIVFCLLDSGWSEQLIFRILVPELTKHYDGNPNHPNGQPYYMIRRNRQDWEYKKCVKDVLTPLTDGPIPTEAIDHSIKCLESYNWFVNDDFRSALYAELTK